MAAIYGMNLGVERAFVEGSFKRAEASLGRQLNDSLWGSKEPILYDGMVQ